METSLTNIPNLKICYVILIILIMSIINIILHKKKISSNYSYLINGVTLIVLALMSSYFKDIIEGIFSLNFLSVKLYIVILIITNIITLITIQKDLNKIYKVTNYLLFALITIILGTILIIITRTKLNFLSTAASQYTVSLVNISIIIFIFYLILNCFIYISINMRNNKNEQTKENTKERKKLKLLSKKSKSVKLKHKVSIKKEIKSVKDTLSPEELLSYKNKNNFYINGIECSIIFEDSIPENIIKNYHILLDDANAKLVNGYTLEENKLLKSICTKLEVNNLNSIDISNLSILNKISVEEYNFLKHLYEE